MVLPLVPKNTILRYPPVGPQPCYLYIQRTGFNQSKPYNIITDATRRMSRTTSAWPNSYAGPPEDSGTFQTFGAYRSWCLSDQLTFNGPLASWFKASLTNAQNLALNRLQAKAFDEEASLGVMLGETREAHKMMSNRLVQLYRGLNSLKRLRFYDAAKAFGLVRHKPPPKKRRKLGKTGKLYWRKHPVRKEWYPSPSRDAKGEAKIKTFSSLVLEWNFGWSPLIKDIQAARAVIERAPYIDRKIRGSGKDVRKTGVIWYYGDSTQNRYESHELVTRVAVGGSYRVSNPNYDLASRLGLANLALVTLELVPFSFLANYMLNLEEWTGNLSDGYRASMVDTWTTAKCSSVRTHTVRRLSDNGLSSSYVSEGLTSYRTAGLPAVTLQVRQRFIPSLTRAVNISSLLVVLFWGKRV